MPKTKQAPEQAMMRPDGPVSADMLAELAYNLYQQMAPKYGLLSPDLTPWAAVPEAQQRLCIAVAACLLHRVDARLRYILHAGYASVPLVGGTALDACEQETGESDA